MLQAPVNIGPNRLHRMQPRQRGSSSPSFWLRNPSDLVQVSASQLANVSIRLESSTSV